MRPHSPSTITTSSMRMGSVSAICTPAIRLESAGLAAIPTTNLIAGVQIALTEPMRIDDVVIVEGEWGRIEEVNTTYVVIRTWDLRRLIVPLTYFMEKPFQNWTRTSTDLIGTVFIHTDDTVPVEEMRAEVWNRTDSD